MKFSLRTLLLVVLAIAVACALLGSRTEFARVVAASVYNLSLLGAVVAMIYRQRAQRAFWIGYAVFGWGAKWLKFSAISRAGFVIHEFLFGPAPTNTIALDRYHEQSANFYNIIDGLEAIVVALLGGYLAKFLYQRRELERREKAKNKSAGGAN
ncbi:hypothetical protein [Aeoliella sp.]|uniref:hypothetical protein n=1 Tax=Aeoliella sp. TaxID=2795800 RepID=UPI003CCBA4B7